MLPFKVHSGPLFDFNAQYGFDYRPGADIIQAVISESGVHEHHRIQANSLGNIAPSDEAFSPDALNILVVGDSFTCDPGYGEPEWPELIKHRLPYKTRVLNYGRGSVGVLQMIDRAATVIQKFKPHLIIVAFVSRHLDRQRRYLSTQISGNRIRSLTHLECTPKPSNYRDYIFVDPRITSEWVRHAGPDDPVIRDLITQRSAHMDTVLYGQDIVSFSSFAEDPGFMSGLNAIRDIPTIYIHLPETRELLSGHLMGRSKAAMKLLTGLPDVTGHPVHLLGGLISSIQSPQDLQNKFARSSDDFHPSLWAKNIYADHIADIVKERVAGLLATSQRHRFSHLQ